MFFCSSTDTSDRSADASSETVRALRLKPDLYFVRRNMQTLLRKRLLRRLGT